MKKTFALLFLALPLWVYAQVEYAEEKTKIASIKKDSRYIYGEGIADTPEAALKAAESSLTTEINRFISENPLLKKSNTVIVGNIRKNTSEIQLKRGNMARIFLYANKESISSSSGVIEVPVGQPEKSKKETAESVPLPEAAVPEISEPAPHPKKPDNPQPATVNEQNIPDIISDIMAARDMTVLQTYLDGQKRAGRIMYGKVSTDINPAWYIVVIAENKVKTILDKGINSRQNFITGEMDDLKNYDMYNKIWLIIYEK